MGKGPRLANSHAAGRHASGAQRPAALLLLVMLGFQPGHANAGTGAQAAPAAPIEVHGARQPTSAHAGGAADVVALDREGASAEVRYVAGWVTETLDNNALPYILIDKVHAKVYVFDAGGQLRGTAAALLGLVPGDASPAGVGKRALSAIGPAQRITPVGRFLASVGPDLHGQDILWVDYDSALALHRVVKGTPAERRAQRLESPTSSDNRISYGCINVPVPFYERFIGPAFSQAGGVVYILPEMSSAREVFKPADARAGVETGHHGP